MKICVVGGGITGLLTSIGIKKHCAHAHVTMIDSDQEPKNLGFGESGPPDMISQLTRLLKIPDQFLDHWIADWIAGSRSVIKFNFKWQNFNGVKDDGYFSGMPSMPEHLAILDPSHTGSFMNNHINITDHNAYMLYDLWYELYLKGRRSISDFQPDINSLYHYCIEHTMPSYKGTMISRMGSIHLNSFELGEWLKKRYANLLDEILVDTVRNISRKDSGDIDYLNMDSGQKVTADLFIDCTGFKRVFAKHLNLPWRDTATEIQHNSVVIVGNGYTENIDKELRPYSTGYGMDYGWAFNVPLLNRVSTGYNYNSNDITADKALEELESLSDPATRLYDPIKLSWRPGVYNTNADKNFALVGLAATFVDPFDANSFALQFSQIFRLIGYINKQKPDSMQELNTFTNMFADNVAERVELHQGLAPRETSEYWRRNHEIARRNNFEDKVFEAMNHPLRSSSAYAQGKLVPYLQHLYLSETIYYGIDMSRRCRQSSAELLNLAEQYFKTINQLNQTRAKTSTSLRDWYTEHKIDIDQYITFRK